MCRQSITLGLEEGNALTKGKARVGQAKSSVWTTAASLHVGKQTSDNCSQPFKLRKCCSIDYILNAHCEGFPLPAGLSTASNQFMQKEMADKEQKRLLLQYTDQLRLSMAGNLQEYQTESFEASSWCRYVPLPGVIIIIIIIIVIIIIRHAS